MNYFVVICGNGKINLVPFFLILSSLFKPNKPIYIAPAMNKEMWANSLIQNNVKLLKEHGHHFIGPEDGSLACGEYGSGRLVDPEEILNQLK